MKEKESKRTNVLSPSAKSQGVTGKTLLLEGIRNPKAHPDFMGLFAVAVGCFGLVVFLKVLFG